MDESIICECGESVFWYFGFFVRCPNCFNEMKEDGDELWMRRFDKELKAYDKNWEQQ